MHGHTWGTSGPQEANKWPKGTQNPENTSLQLDPESDMRGAKEPPLQPKSPIKASKDAQKGKLERGLETRGQKSSFPDPLQQPKLNSRAGGSSILTLTGDCILEPFWEAFWSQVGAKLANYTHFGPLWLDLGPIWAVKFKMQTRLDEKCSFGEATR